MSVPMTVNAVALAAEASVASVTSARIEDLYEAEARPTQARSFKQQENFNLSDAPAKRKSSGQIMLRRIESVMLNGGIVTYTSTRKRKALVHFNKVYIKSRCCSDLLNEASKMSFFRHTCQTVESRIVPM